MLLGVPGLAPAPGVGAAAGGATPASVLFLGRVPTPADVAVAVGSCCGGTAAAVVAAAAVIAVAAVVAAAVIVSADGGSCWRIPTGLWMEGWAQLGLPLLREAWTSTTTLVLMPCLAAKGSVAVSLSKRVEGLSRPEGGWRLYAPTPGGPTSVRVAGILMLVWVANRCTSMLLGSFATARSSAGSAVWGRSAPPWLPEVLVGWLIKVMSSLLWCTLFTCTTLISVLLLFGDGSAGWPVAVA